MNQPPQRKQVGSTKWIVIGIIACALGGGSYYLITERARVEGRATQALLELCHEEFPAESTVAELSGGGYGKHSFFITDKDWEVQKNDSSAYPFVANVSITYQRRATISHDIKSECEKDDKTFLAHYGTISWLNSRELAQTIADHPDHPLHEKCQITLLYDKVNRRWIEKSRKIE